MTEAVRIAFADQISELEQSVLKMGSVVEQMLHTSIQALTTRNAEIAEAAIAMDDTVDQYNLDIENKCLKLLALQQPMARDLRTIAGTMKVITDIERMGDYVVDIAKTVRRLCAKPLTKELVHIPQMSDTVKKMLREVLEAYVSRNLDHIEHMIQHDDEVDRLNKTVYAELIERMEKNPAYIEESVPLIMIARYLERLADHVTNVGERVFYMETGQMRKMNK
jgi:phosphate transport system protein